MANNPQTWCATLAHTLKDTGLTQAQAAGLLGVSLRTITGWLGDGPEPHILTQEGALARLAKVQSSSPQPQGRPMAGTQSRSPVAPPMAKDKDKGQPVGARQPLFKPSGHL